MFLQPGSRARARLPVVKMTVPTLGRLSLTSAVPITITDVTAATTVFLTAGQAPVSNGINLIQNISAQLSIALDSNAGHTGYHQSGNNFDVFKFIDNGLVRIGTGPSWASGAVAGSNTVRGTGAGSTAIQYLGNTGAQVNTNPIVLRWGNAALSFTTVPVSQAVYLGSFRTTADGQTEDSVLNRLLFNAFDIAERKLLKQYTGASTPYSVGAWQQAYASATNQVTVLLGVTGTLVSMDVEDITVSSSTTPRITHAGIGIDSTTVNSADITSYNSPTTTVAANNVASYKGSPGLGFHTIAGLQYGSSVGGDTITWFPTAGQAQGGIKGGVWI
jgi:hypothetical protein